MSEMPDQISIQGDVSGQIAVGNYINQFQNLNGCNISIMTPDQRPKWERHNTPVQIRPRRPEFFFDRTSEINRIETSIRAVTPLAVSGVSGIGKTSLLKQLAHGTEIEPFPNGIYSFSAYDLKLDDMLQCLFSAFYESNVPVKPDRAEIQKALQDVKALILIDDLQLSRDETQVVLDIAPGCMFITAWADQTLHGPSGMMLLGGLPEDDAVLLFEQELGRSLNEIERSLVCEICALLDGHPEKICWVAARIREEKLPLDEIVSKLKVEGPESLLRESVERLPDVEKQILAVLTGVEGTALSQEHLAALVPAEEIQLALGNLTARGLIRATEADFSISETVSSVLSEASQESTSEQKLIEYFVRWLEEEKPSAARVAAVRGALSVLIRKASQRGMWPAVVTMGQSLEPILIQQGYWQAWSEILRSMLDASTSLGNRHLEGWTLHQLGSRSLCLGARDEAVRQLSEALSIRTSIGDQSGAALTQHNLSLIAPAAPLEHGSEPHTPPKPFHVTGAAIATAAVAAVAVLAGVVLARPRPPALILPEDMFIQTSGTGLALEWQTSRGGVEYQLQLDEQQDFASPLIETSTQSTRHDVEMDLEQGIYFWRVRAVSRFNRAGNWSEPRTFTISFPPAKVTLTSPAEQYIETSPESLVVVWEPTDNTTAYFVQVDDSDDFNSPVYESRVAETSHSPSSALDQGVYYWRVHAINPFDTPGEWSDAWTFTISIPPATAPVLIEPGDGSILEAITRPLFRWQSVDNATDYRIQVDDSIEFESPHFEEQVSDTESASIPDLDQGEYYWRVQALNIFGTAGDWSLPWTFIISVPPAPPTLISPVDGFVVSDTRAPTYEWSLVESAASFEIQVDDDPGFNTPDYDERMSDTAHSSAIELGQGEHFWRVRAFNVYDTPGEWSDQGVFIISIPPEPPILVAPFYNALIDTTNRPSFDWQAVSNGTQYEIQVDNSSGFNSPAYQTTDTDTGRASTVGLAQGLFSWRVRAINEYGTPGDWSETWQFTVSIPPVKPALQAPANGAYILANSNTDFVWNGVQNANQYQVQVDNNLGFSSPDRESFVQGNNQNQTFSVPNGTYYWRVRAFNVYDTPGDWSSSWQVIAIPPLAAPILVSPANNSQQNTSQVTFDWNGVAGAASYRLQVDNNANFSSPEVNGTTNATGATITSGLVPENHSCNSNPNFTYYWRVRAIDQHNLRGTWSSVWILRLRIVIVC